MPFQESEGEVRQGETGRFDRSDRLLPGEAFRDEKVASVSIVLLENLTLKSSFSMSGFGLHLTVDVKR